MVLICVLCNIKPRREKLLQVMFLQHGNVSPCPAEPRFISKNNIVDPADQLSSEEAF